MIRADLHIHTYYSDGTQSPRDVVSAAQRAGVNLISVTDHDNSNASKEVRALAAERGITAVDGEEISAYDGDVKVHILGYGMDYNCPAYKNFSAKLYKSAEERTYEILQNLSAVGLKITVEEVIKERTCDSSPLHAMYIARAGAKRGYASSPFDFYAKYLNFGTVGFSRLGRPTPEETCAVIYECGGISSLAHPGRITMDKTRVEALISRLADLSLAGIEAVYSGHTVIQTQYYKELADRYNLLITGGSDTHSVQGNRSVGTPAFYPDGKLLSALKII